ncbi:LysR family transcriptional regulator [Vibrio makurazakiensis]|uniref:LysR family transcriptional regulator n=1 Tax=Vibrio makurazakiensis TaxID=2910250 RepID=UPI003D0B4795
MKKAELYFLTVAMQGTIKSAAEVLNIAQPSLTSSIKKLELELGVELLIRHPRGVELSTYGKHYFQYVEKLKLDHDQMVRQLSEMKLRQQGKLKIGTGEAWWELFVKNAILSFQQHAPQSSLHIEFGNNLNLMSHLIQGDIDLFIGHEIHGLDEKHRVRFIPILQDREAVYVRAGHPIFSSLPKGFEKNVGVEVNDEVKQLTSDYPELRVTSDHTRNRSILSIPPKTVTNSNTTFDIDSLSAAIDFLKSTDAIMPYTAEIQNWMESQGIVALYVKRFRKGNVGIYTKEEASTELSSQSVNACIQEIKKAYRNAKF